MPEILEFIGKPLELHDWNISVCGGSQLITLKFLFVYIFSVSKNKKLGVISVSNEIVYKIFHDLGKVKRTAYLGVSNKLKAYIYFVYA